jgi:hypothetical protein
MQSMFWKNVFYSGVVLVMILLLFEVFSVF